MNIECMGGHDGLGCGPECWRGSMTLQEWLTKGYYADPKSAGKLLSALRRVVEMHEQGTISTGKKCDWCVECIDSEGLTAEWPCHTIKAICEELGVEP